ncbi:homeobox protein engrailed-1-like [Ovis aries]|uniref:homeobox protein engrailed-1-like n=1 Tax=Ovis aries TaxID=9940 RepID=UPI001C2EF2D5|nr:homeobox protein engrailed-1-like [Ovis aries]
MVPFPHLSLLTHPVDREAENPHFFPPTPSSRPLPPPVAPKPRSSHRGNQRDRSLPSCPDHRRQHPPPPTTRRPPAPRTLTHDRAAAAAAGCGLQAAVTRTGALLAALAIPGDWDSLDQLARGPPPQLVPPARVPAPTCSPASHSPAQARGKGGRGSGPAVPATVATAVTVAAAVAAAAAAEAAAATVAEAVAEASVAEAEAEVEAEASPWRRRRRRLHWRRRPWR